MAGTFDNMIRAFDSRTGEILWEHELEAAGFATPCTYEVKGKQYVTIAAGGGKGFTKPGDAFVTFPCELLLLFSALWRDDRPTAQQPIPFSHKRTPRPESSVGLSYAAKPGFAAGIPREQICMGCHTTMKKDSPAIQKLAAYAKRKKPVPWVRLYRFRTMCGSRTPYIIRKRTSAATSATVRSPSGKYSPRKSRHNGGLHGMPCKEQGPPRLHRLPRHALIEEGRTKEQLSFQR